MILDLIVWAVDVVQFLAFAFWWWGPLAVVAAAVLGRRGLRASGRHRTGGDGER